MLNRSFMPKKRVGLITAQIQLDDISTQVDAIFLATPVRTILTLLDRLAKQVTEPCLVMDIGSTKREIVSRMERLPGNLHSIGGHPMCGREVSGIQQADALLYQNQPFILVPHSKTTEETIFFAQQVVHTIGSRAVMMEPKQHDRIVAAISHLPYLISCGLVGTAEATAQEESELVWEVAASGFRDTSRLAASDITMMLDILLTNRKAILNSVNQFKSQLDKLEHLIAAEEEELVRANPGENPCPSGKFIFMTTLRVTNTKRVKGDPGCSRG